VKTVTEQEVIYDIKKILPFVLIFHEVQDFSHEVNDCCTGVEKLKLLWLRCNKYEILCKQKNSVSIDREILLSIIAI
jgi:hypothetical protein